MENFIVVAMAQSLAKVLLHAVFSTKDRRPFLKKPDARMEVHSYLGGILANRDCQPLIVGGVEDHVHLLFVMSRTHTVADVIRELKRSSTNWIKAEIPAMGEFAWQSGYGIFSIGVSQEDAARNYIATQEEHHRKVSFQDEFRRLLEKYKMAYDERYVWD